MPDTTHKEQDHMCALVEKKADLEVLKDLARGAQYICSACGRSAANSERLCRPEKL